MNELYFRSAEEAASVLGLPLLVTSSSAPAVPRAGSQLSDYAVDTLLAARVFHSLRLPDVPGGQVVWVTAPYGTLEHLGWAVGLAERAAGTGRTAYVAALDPTNPLRSIGRGTGLRLPAGVLERLQAFGVSSAAGWGSDMQGVRLALPVADAPAGEAPELPARWMVVLARSVPEEQELPQAARSATDGIILVAAIRDHTREELCDAVRTLREAGSPMLGLIAMGPVPSTAFPPAERRDRVGEDVAPSAHEVAVSVPQPAAPAQEARPVAEPARGEATAPPGVDAGDRASHEIAPSVPSEGPPGIPPSDRDSEALAGREIAGAKRGGGVNPIERPVPLVTAWMRPMRRRRWLRVIPLALLLIAAGAGWWFRKPIGLLASSTWTNLQSRYAPATAKPETPPDGGPQVPPSPSGTAWADTFVVHVGSYQHQNEAQREAVRLSQLSVESRIIEVMLPERGRWFRVVLGAYPDSVSAMQEANRLRSEGSISFAQVLGHGGRGRPQYPTAPIAPVDSGGF